MTFNFLNLFIHYIDGFTLYNCLRGRLTIDFQEILYGMFSRDIS